MSSMVWGPEGAKANNNKKYALKAKIKKLTSELANLSSRIYGLTRTYIGPGGVWTSVAAYNDYMILSAQYEEKQKERSTADFDLRFLERQLSAAPVASPTGVVIGGGNQTTSSTPQLGSVTGGLIYNLPAVKDAYFADNMGIFDIKGGNQPKQYVTDAKELWTNGIASKGMLQTWTPPNGVTTGSFVDGYDLDNKLGTVELQKYGFQFLYNPGNITMTYSGNPEIDVTLMLSGREAFNPVSTATTQSTVGFEILLNRMFDLTYFDKTTGQLQAGADVIQLYGRQPTDGQNDLSEIFEKGTMYDVEFLLKTLFGFEVDSQLGRGKTADMGFVIPRPVELHLGNKLRYLVYINGFSLNHVIFDERMVPMFTTLNVTANRVPDYGGSNVVNGAAGSNTTSSSTATWRNLGMQ